MMLDLDGDGNIDIYDIRIVYQHLGTEQGDPEWDEYSRRADLNSDGIVDITDVAIITSELGKGWGSPSWGVTNTIYDIQATLQHGVFTTPLPPNQPPTCIIKLQKDGVEINEIDVGEFFDIYVGNSTDDTGIKQVRFSSDDAQDGIPTGEWTEWFDWDTSLGDWNASTKIKRWAFATAGDKEVWAEVKDDIGQTAKCSANISANLPVAVITSPLEITPFKDTYYVGDTLTAKFTITNRGTESVTFDVLVVGGRDPTGEVVDFDKAYGITLNPSDSYDYQGFLTLPDKPGTYHFFCAYQTPDGNWNTNIVVEIDGKIVEDFEEARRYREKDITVFEKTYTWPAPSPALWEKISGPWVEKSRSLSQIAVHPNNPDIIYAVVKHYHYYWGYQGDKLYKSTNAGADWSPINEGLPRTFGFYGRINAIGIAPSNPDTIYLGITSLDPYSGLSGGTVYKSTNGGLKWTRMSSPYAGRIFKSYYPISSMVVHPTNPDIVYAGTIGGGIWRTNDGGKSWKKIWDEPVHKETLLDVVAIAISPANPSVIYAAAYNFQPSEAMGWSRILIPNRLIKSEDGGETWERLRLGLLTAAPKIDDIVVDNRNADVVYVITCVSGNNRVYKSVDGGKTWSDASGTGGSDPLPDVDLMLRTIGMYGVTGKTSSISIYHDHSNVIYVASTWGFNDVYFSPNSGENWFPLGLKDKYGQELGLYIQQVVFASNTDSRVLYAAAIDGLFKIDLSEGLIATRLRSPGELRVYDSQGRVTGLVNGEIKEEIPNSAYFNNTVEILSLSDSYRYEVAGTEDGSYGLMVAFVIQGESNAFTATDMPISTNAIHQYTINWDALALGEEGVAIQIDSDGDGIFEHTFTSDSELSHNEFVRAYLCMYTHVDKTFKPNEVSQRRKGSVMSWTYISNTGYLSLSEITFNDTILDGWTTKDLDRTISVTLFIEGAKYEIPYDELDYVAIEDGKYVVYINFTAGVDLYQFNATSGMDEYRMTIYAFEPGWVLEIKYPMHPPTDLLAGDYEATVSVTVMSPEGITVTVDDTATLHVK